MHLRRSFDLVVKGTLLSCTGKKVEVVEILNKNSSKEFNKENNPTFMTWFTADETRSDDSFSKEFLKYSENGIVAILINTYAHPGPLARLVPIAKNASLEVHAWMFTINWPGDKIAEQHPEWYAVSRDGKSCYDNPPYVAYYKWLCPTREGAKAHILSLVEGLSKAEGIASVHLDYIRYSDVFLPISLLPKYNIVQNEELARYDFCYCDVCTSEFEKIHNKNPNDFRNPAIDMERKNFRLPLRPLWIAAHPVIPFLMARPLPQHKFLL